VLPVLMVVGRLEVMVGRGLVTGGGLVVVAGGGVFGLGRHWRVFPWLKGDGTECRWPQQDQAI